MEELLNELNEVVYVVDLENYELLYLNKYGLKLFGYEKFDEIKGITCHEVFYKTNSPCSFCNASRLTNKEYHEWECKNILLNKYFVIKEKLIKWNGKNVHMAVAMDITKKEEERITLEQTLENERIVLNCIKMMHSSFDIDVSITNTLEVMGEYLNGQRTYIFELAGDNTLNNTYEWCAEGVEREKEFLQEVPFEELKRWIEIFNQGLPVIMENIEDIKDLYKEEYTTLSFQKIHSLIAIPIMENMEKLSYYDTLTGALNRNAYIRDLEKTLHTIKRLGVVFVDVNGLKSVNDHFGHTAGDELIVSTFNEIKDVFHDALKYRTGGDEFVIFCRNETEEAFMGKISKLKKNLKSSNGGMAAVGANWTLNAKDINQSIKMAEINMYKDKKKFYNYQDENEKNIIIKKHYFQN